MRRATAWKVPNPPRLSLPHAVNPGPPNQFRFPCGWMVRRMWLDLKRVAEYIRQATTEELLDRVTVYRLGMEPAALDLMEGELDRRGVTRHDIEVHDAYRREDAIMLPDGTALRCSFCDRPAVVRKLGCHKLFGLIPLLPWRYRYCSVHRGRVHLI